MKLLVQSDDYGITRGVADGIICGIAHGIIRNTGLFANMPWRSECVEKIRPYLDQIAFGIDLNITTGSALSAHEQIPSITKEKGEFFSSWESRKMDQDQNGEHAVYEEVLSEFEAQIAEFIRLTGKKPDYIHSHAYSTPLIEKAQRFLAEKHGIPFSSDVMRKLTGEGIPEYRIGWYLRPGTLENQAASSLKEYILQHGSEWKKEDIRFLIAHAGYVDQDLIRFSSYTLYRTGDLEGLSDAEVMAWIRDNHIELITYKDLNN